MLPPLTVAGSAAALAVASLLTGDTGPLRVLTVLAALTAVTGAAIARAWDRSAGRRVAELVTLRTRDEWRTDERIAELEIDLEEFREIRGRLEKKLRGKRSELARLRTEHAALLRRYATAESERARMLEARRLQVDGTAARPLALGTGISPVGPAAYLKAAEALRNLPRNTAKQQARQTVADARRRDTAASEEPQGKHASGAPAPLPVREPRLVPAVAAAVLPYAKPAGGGAHPPHRSVGGFDFFGTQKAAGGSEEDSAGSAASAESDDPDHERAHSEVIDLTAHDDTEQLDVAQLRAQA
jgi:hypothetical protein